ncbi:MAG: type I-U CRISPR-associated protein Cas5/Cas6 [Alphaproteobacteria bacterium]|nr:MAG: type I-U CRISPR-associated protein Cas5/Cas6 [Alphaproteobacteria bacterium]
MAGDVNARPRPAVRLRRVPAEPPSPRPFAADPADWVVFEHAGGERPDLRAQAALAEAMRLALMEAWTKANGSVAPAWISGHEADRTPAREAHLAVLPMANLGWTHSDGRLMGLALVPPSAEAEAWREPGPEAFSRRQAFRRALARLGEADAEGRTVLTLAPPGGKAWSWRLMPAASGLKSLDPDRYLRPARIWASATPVLLDRHLKSSGPPERSNEAEGLVRAACPRAGLPDLETVVLTKHAAIRGTPSARPAGGNPRWTGWARRRSFGRRDFVHARLVFDAPVAGPVLIGAGRFHGLGLFLPMAEGSR